MVTARDDAKFHPSEFEICLPFQTAWVIACSSMFRVFWIDEDVEAVLFSVAWGEDGELVGVVGDKREVVEDALHGWREGEEAADAAGFLRFLVFRILGGIVVLIAFIVGHRSPSLHSAV